MLPSGAPTVSQTMLDELSIVTAANRLKECRLFIIIDQYGKLEEDRILSCT